MLSPSRPITRRCLLALAAAAWLTLTPRTDANAQGMTSFAGKQVTIAIGYGTGGTYYTYAKLMADHLGRFISGRPSIIVQSMPGAGGVRMLNAAARIMPGDGTQLFVPPDTMVLTQLLAKDGVQFDARQFHYLGTINQQNNFFVVRREVSTSLDALKRREVVVGHSGNGSAGHLITSIAGESLGLKLRLIAGYEGSRDTLIAFERKEIDGGTFGWQTWAQSVPHWFVGQASFAVPMFQVGIRPDPDMPHVPLLGSLVKQHDHALVGLIDTQGQIGRTLAAPPGTPKELVAQLRSSLEAMVADPEFRDDIAKRKLRLIPLTGPELQTAVERAVGATQPALIARARRLIE